MPLVDSDGSNEDILDGVSFNPFVVSRWLTSCLGDVITAGLNIDLIGCLRLQKSYLEFLHLQVHEFHLMKEECL